MLNIVLFEPEIPPNTGNIIRLAANTGCCLHIIEPTGFALDDKRLRRAGLDYGEWKDIQVYRSWDHFIEQCYGHQENTSHLFAITTKGSQFHHETHYSNDDFLIFGPETRGLPDNILNNEYITGRIRIPMMPESRSMNLANSVAVIVYEAWRQQSFTNAV